MNLRLHHNIGRCDFSRDLFCFLWGGGHFAARCRYPKFPQQLFRLVFVNVHRRRSTTKRGTFAHSIEFLPRTWSRNNRSSLAPEYSGPINARDQQMNGMFCAKIVHRSFARRRFQRSLQESPPSKRCNISFPDFQNVSCQSSSRLKRPISALHTNGPDQKTLTSTSGCSCHNGHRESGRGRARVATDPNSDARQYYSRRALS